MPLQYITKGISPFSLSAGTWNAHNRATEIVLGDKFSQFASRSLRTPIERIDVENTTGEDLPAGSVVGLDEFTIDPAAEFDEWNNGTPCIKAVEPDVDDHRSKFAILLEDVADGAIGKAAIAGAVRCLVDMNSATDRFAAPTTGEYEKLSSGGSGAEILAVETGTGDKWAIVRLGLPQRPALAVVSPDGDIAGTEETLFTSATPYTSGLGTEGVDQNGDTLYNTLPHTAVDGEHYWAVPVDDGWAITSPVVPPSQKLTYVASGSGFGAGGTWTEQSAEGGGKLVEIDGAFLNSLTERGDLQMQYDWYFALAVSGVGPKNPAHYCLINCHMGEGGAGHHYIQADYATSPNNLAITAAGMMRLGTNGILSPYYIESSSGVTVAGNTLTVRVWSR